MQDSGLVTGIVRGIRQRIAQGVWARGALLPTRGELAVLFSTSPSTIQSAIRVLTSEGSVITRKRAGTCIAPAAPEYGRFALVMSDHGPRPESGSVFFHDRLLQAAAQIPDLLPGCRLEAWSAQDPRLHALVLSGALEGVFYIGSPELMPPVAGTGVPLACFHYDGAPWYGDVNLTTSKLGFLETCIKLLRRDGCRSFALLDTDSRPVSAPTEPGLGAYAREIAGVVHQHGGECPAAWVQCVNPGCPLTPYQVVKLLLRHPHDRPDAIILFDDHLLPAILEAVRDLALAIPRQLAICVLGYDAQDEHVDGCKRVGFDLERVLVGTLQQLALIRQGKPGRKELPCWYMELTTKRRRNRKTGA